MQPQPQQHQQVVIQQTGAHVVAQPMYVVQPAPVVEKYRHRQSTVIGALLVVAGALSIIANVADLVVGTGVKYNKGYSYHHPDFTKLSDFSFGIVCHGLWCGATVVIAGGLGIAAGRRRRKCMIVMCMVMTIFGAMFAVLQVTMAAVGAGVVQNTFGNRFDGNCGTCKQEKIVYIIAIVLALLGAVELTLCIWESALTCVVCCCCRSTRRMAVVGYRAGVTVVTQQQLQQQPMQPVVMAAPPAGYPAAYPQAQAYPPQQQQSYPGYAPSPPAYKT